MSLSNIASYNASFLKEKFERIQKAEATPLTAKAESLRQLVAEGGTVTKIDQMKVGIIEAYLLADTIAKGMCQMDTIKQGQIAIYRTPAARQSMEFYKIASYAGKPVKGYVSADKQAMAEYYFMASDVVEIPRWNPTFPDNVITQEERANRDLAYSLERMVDTDLTTLIDTQYVATWAADTLQFQDDRIVGIPAGNIVDASVQGEINIEVIKLILYHFAQLGRKVDSIYYPMTDIRDIWDWQAAPDTTTAGSEGKDLIPNSVQDEIWSSGVVTNLFGYKVNMVPCNTLASGTIKVMASPMKANDPSPRGAAFFFTVPFESYLLEVPAPNPIFRGLIAMMGMGMLALPQQALNTAKVLYK